MSVLLLLEELSVRFRLPLVDIDSDFVSQLDITGRSLDGDGVGPLGTLLCFGLAAAVFGKVNVKTP